MPFIQCDIQEGLSEAKKRELVERFTQVTHEAIGSSVAHINVVIREHPSANLGEAGVVDRHLISGNVS
jgi:4-oxalocrotonate tautomerase family enzyme